VPTFNAGIAAWQANNLDSAIASFRRASAMLARRADGHQVHRHVVLQHRECGFAVMYFRKAANAAAADPKFAQDRKDALPQPQAAFSRASSSQRRRRRPIAEYLGLFPNDAEIMAALGGVYMQKAAKDSTYRDSAFAIYRQIIARRLDGVFPALSGRRRNLRTSLRSRHLDRGATIARESRAKRPPMTPVRIRAHCDSVTTGIAKSYLATRTRRSRSPRRRSTRASKINPNTARR